MKGCETDTDQEMAAGHTLLCNRVTPKCMFCVELYTCVEFPEIVEGRWRPVGTAKTVHFAANACYCMPASC